MSGFYHTPVLANEVMGLLNPSKGKIIVDGTLGGGGHTRLMLQSGASVIGIDRDLDAIRNSEALKNEYETLTVVKNNFLNIPQVLEELDIELVDGILIDLGVSSYQLDEPSRGFSYMNDGPLDMRMDEHQAFTAYDVVNTYERKMLYKIIRDYGEERFAGSIAAKIVAAREEKPIETTDELVQIIKRAIPVAARQRGPHPAKRTFQAIRIEVNDELSPLYDGIKEMALKLKKDGVIAVITFHSLEDRIIKNALRDLQSPCTCPAKIPICVCGKEQVAKVLTRKPILPGESEVEGNPRARSAKLRAARRVQTF